MRVVIARASGLIGRPLVDRLRARGDTVVRLVRRPVASSDEARWDPAGGVLDPLLVEGADAVVNLAGASIGRLPWTRSYRREIRRSRISATKTIVDAIHAASAPPRVLVNASAVGFYGSRPGERLTEQSAPGDGFLSNVVQQWEWEAMRAADATRVVLARTAIVLASEGVLQPLMLLARTGLAGPLAGGRQHWPWVSLDDEVGALVHLIDSDLAGPVNIVGPEAATAATLTSALAAALHRPYWLPVPRLAVELVLGDAARDLLLVDQQVVPERLAGDGFVFTHRTVASGIDAAVAPD